jgi:hypothetical protein
VTLGFRREIVENCVLLGHYAASSGNLLPTFRDNLLVLSSGVKIVWNNRKSARGWGGGRGLLTTRATLHTEWNYVYTCRDLSTFNAMSDPVRYRSITQYTIHVKAGTDCVNCLFSRQIYIVLLIPQLQTFMSALPYVKRHTLAELYPKYKLLHNTTVGRDSSVGTATRYGLDRPGIESRWGSRFSASLHTGPGAHPASYTMDTGSFPGVKRPGRGVDHPHHLAPRLRKE